MFDSAVVVEAMRAAGAVRQRYDDEPHSLGR